MKRQSRWIPSAVFMALTFSVLTSCSAVPPPSPPSVQIMTGRHPDFGVRVSTDVGSAIYREFDYVKQDGVRLVEGYRSGYALGSVAVSPSDLIEARGAEFCSNTRAYRDPLTGPYDVVCFQDSDGDGAFEKIRVPLILLGQWRALSQSLRYRKTSAAADPGGMKAELVYQGRAGDIIKVAYREYQGNLARPAFQQEAQYTLTSDGSPTEIAFRGSRISVFDANNNQIS